MTDRRVQRRERGRDAPAPGVRATSVAVSALATIATTALAVVGVVVLGWLAIAAITGAQLIVFKTGSMSPTMPVGAAAVVVPVAADDLRVDDVVTVPSHGSGLPVTHRIVAVEPVDAAPGAVALTLRGDANQEDDAAPYVVTEAHRVVVSVPALGTVIAVAQTPISMGVLTLSAAFLVVRAFWPQRVDDDADEADDEDAADGTVAPDDGQPGESSDDLRVADESVEVRPAMASPVGVVS